MLRSEKEVQSSQFTSEVTINLELTRRLLERLKRNMQMRLMRSFKNDRMRKNESKTCEMNHYSMMED